MRELRGAPEPTLAELLRLLTPVDLVLVEGFKRESVPKIEIYREAVGKPQMHQLDEHIVALVGDPSPSSRLPYAQIDDVAAIADLVLTYAVPIQRLFGPPARG
jgi:molybdopterin-guanine dinucleotide biosynthesis protein B